MHNHISVLFALFLQGLCGATRPATVKELGWQAHSQNDLRLWPQLAMKSTRQMLSVKVDPHDFNQSQGFRLTHDDPVEGVVYNTTHDMLIASRELLERWPALSLRVALCFKQGADACDGSNASQQWLAEVDRLYTKGEELRDAFPGRLEFLLDGNAKPSSCLQDRWRPWNSTWILFDHSPYEAGISNDLSKGYDRFTVFNLPDVSALWDMMRLIEYGKFLSGPYPLQLWEPDSQKEIISYASEFTQGPHLSHPHLGFDFAINIDPKMWDVFTASQTHLAWNLELPIQHNAAAPFLVTFDEHDIFLVLHKVVPDSSYSQALADNGDNGLHLLWQWSTFNSSSPFGEVSALKSASLLLSDPPIAAVRDGNRTVHIVTRQKIMKITVLPDGSVSFHQDTGLTPVSRLPLAACLHSPGNLALLVQGGSVATMKAATLSVRHSGDDSVLWVTPELPGHALVMSADIVKVAEHFLVTVSNGSHVFLATNGSASWKLLGVGGQVSMSTLSSMDSETLVGLTNDGGFCFNSHKRNTKAPVKVCDQIPEPCKSALDYTVGTFTQWADFANSAEFVTPCSELLHGTYDFGANPSSSLVNLGGSQVALWSVHAGPSNHDETCGCGTPVPRPGKLVLDGFVLTSKAPLPKPALNPLIV